MRLLVAGGLALCAAGADARGGGNGHGESGDGYFVGITPAPGGSSEDSGFQGGGFQANTSRHSGHAYQNGHGGDGTIEGGYRGY